MENIQRENADILDAVWAALAQTVIPPQPVSGQAYRNANVAKEVIQAGQKFNSVADSALFNQFLYLLSSYGVSFGETGILPWISLQKYRKGGLCIGPDGSLWQAQQDIEAGDTTVPGTDNTKWDVPMLNGNKGFAQATEETAGIAKIATADEVEAGTDDGTIITPAKLANALQNISSLPVAFMTMWPSATLPADGKWMERNGDILTIADYPGLFAILGNLYGGDGTTTFALPDDRGLVERGWDHGRGYDSARTFGSEQQDAIRNITGTFALELGATVPTGAFYSGKTTPGANQSGGSNDVIILFDSSRVVPTAPENRMKNRAYLPIIKVLP